MSYTPTTWTTGDTISASALNKIENGIADAGGGGWDAVIRLTHAHNSGADTLANLTPSIVSGTATELIAKCANGKCPVVLVEYVNQFSGSRFAAPMGFIVSYGEGYGLYIMVAGFSPLGDNGQSTIKIYGVLSWTSSDTISWYSS